MDMQRALDIAKFTAEAFTALAVVLGTLRNLLTHAGFISAAERTKIGAALDRASFVCEKGKKGLLWVLTLPGFASQPGAPAAADLKIVPLLFAALLPFAGCATYGLPKGASLADKITADAGVLGAVKNDISGKCPKLAPLAPLIAKALAVAADPYNVLNDVMTALSAFPELKQDYDAVKCAVQVVLDDYRLYFKGQQPGTAAAAKTAQAIDTLERVLVLLDEQGSSAAFACAGR